MHPTPSHWSSIRWIWLTLPWNFEVYKDFIQAMSSRVRAVKKSWSGRLCRTWMKRVTSLSNSPREEAYFPRSCMPVDPSIWNKVSMLLEHVRSSPVSYSLSELSLLSHEGLPLGCSCCRAPLRLCLRCCTPSPSFSLYFVCFPCYSLSQRAFTFAALNRNFSVHIVPASSVLNLVVALFLYVLEFRMKSISSLMPPSMTTSRTATGSSSCTEPSFPSFFSSEILHFGTMSFCAVHLPSIEPSVMLRNQNSNRRGTLEEVRAGGPRLPSL